MILMFSNLDEGSRFPMNFYYLCSTIQTTTDPTSDYRLQSRLGHRQSEEADESDDGDEAEVGESAFPIREFLTSLNSPRRVVAELTLNCNLMQSWNAAFTSPWSPLFIALPQDE